MNQLVFSPRRVSCYPPRLCFGCHRLELLLDFGSTVFAGAAHARTRLGSGSRRLGGASGLTLGPVSAHILTRLGSGLGQLWVVVFAGAVHARTRLSSGWPALAGVPLGPSSSLPRAARDRGLLNSGLRRRGWSRVSLLFEAWPSMELLFGC